MEAWARRITGNEFAVLFCPPLTHIEHRNRTRENDKRPNMPSLYALGARQRKLLLKQEDEWHLYESALILKIDSKTGETQPCVEYKSPPQARASQNSSNVF